MRILVVEDDAKIASFVVRGLKQAGYAVDHAPDGETGLALADSTDYDAAIVDVMLPQLDGISLVKRLRAPPHPGAVPQRQEFRRRPREGSPGRRRRLSHETFRLLRTRRAGAGAHPP